MKKLALLLCMFGLLPSILSASNSSWRYDPGQTKFYALLVSVGKNNDPTQQDRFWVIVEGIKLALIDCEIVPRANIVVLKQVSSQDYQNEFYRLVNQAGKNGVLFIFLMVHGTGYNSALQIPFGGFITHHNPLGEIDARADSLSLRAFTYSCWMREAGPMPLNQWKVEWSQAGKITLTDTLVTSADTTIVENYLAVFNTYGWRLFPEKSNLSLGEQCALIREQRYLLADKNKDGQALYYTAPALEHCPANDEFWTLFHSYLDSTAISDSPMSRDRYGLNRQIDYDQDRLPDHIFVLMTEAGPRLACDLNYIGEVGDYNDLQADLLDTDNDGLFDKLDFNGDGIFADTAYIDYLSGIQFTDRIVYGPEQAKIENIFPGVTVRTDASCYAGDHLDDIFPGNVGFSFVSKFAESCSGYLADLPYYFYTLYNDYKFTGRPKSTLSFFNLNVKEIWGEAGRGAWLEDNGDHKLTKGPWTGDDSQLDGSLTKRIPLFVANGTTSIKNNLSANMADSLFQNYPNPFGTLRKGLSTRIKYSLAQPSQVKLLIYNIGGQLVKTLVETHQPAGVYEVVWRGQNEQGQLVASGVYLYELITKNKTFTKAMALIK